MLISNIFSNKLYDLINSFNKKMLFAAVKIKMLQALDYYLQEEIKLLIILK